MTAVSSTLQVGAMPLEIQSEGAAGDAASPAALGSLRKSLAAAQTGKLQRRQQKAIQFLKASITAIRARDYQTGALRALDALQVDETSGLAWHILAIAREKAGETSDAILAYEAALKLMPDDLGLIADLGRLAQRLSMPEIAEKLYLKHLTRSPGHVEVTNNLAAVLRDLGRYEEAIDLLKGILPIEAEQPMLWNTLGTVLTDRGDMAESIVFFDEALRLDPGFSKALYNRANARMALGEPRESLRDIDIALAQVDEPLEIDTMRVAKALTQLLVGDLRDAFVNYEARFSPHLEGSVRYVTDCPRMEAGDAVRGRRLLVVGEQGLGDEVLFANALPDLMTELGPDGHLTLAIEPRLVELMQRSFPEATVIPHRTVRFEGRLTRLVERPEGSPVDEAWTPIGNVLGRYRPDTDAFPERTSYLRPDPERVGYWRNVLSQAGSGPKVGVVWKSLRVEGSRGRYFSAFDLWRPVLTTPGAVFVNLQYGDVTAELAAAAAAGITLWTPPGIDLKDDLDDLAALTSALDLLIGPPNATSNIGAACGAPWWAMATPDDWLRLGTDRYPCYPSARVFPIDGFGDWEGAMGRVHDALVPWIAGSGGRNAA